jgi:hypothetical protein
MQNTYLMPRSGAAAPGTVAQEFAALLHEARLVLRTACREQMAARQPPGRRPYWMPTPTQVTPVLTCEEEFLAAGKDAAEAADKLCGYAKDCAAAINDLINYFGEAKNLEPKDADWLCAYITDLCCKADCALQNLHRQAAALEMAKQAACDNIELRYVCPPHPCAVEGPGEFTSREPKAGDADAKEEEAREEQAFRARQAETRFSEEREDAAEERPPEPEGTRRRPGRRREGSPG